jgi:hypothetical protein
LQIITSAAAVNDGNWHLAQAKLSSTTMQLCLDGASLGTISGISAEANNGWWRIGSYRLVAWTAGADGYYTGDIDEVRISYIGRSLTWHQTEYNNQSSIGIE